MLGRYRGGYPIRWYGRLRLKGDLRRTSHLRFSFEPGVIPQFGCRDLACCIPTSPIRLRNLGASASFPALVLLRHAEGRIEDLLEIAESGLIVGEASANDLVRIVPSISVRDFTAAWSRTGSLLVS